MVDPPRGEFIEIPTQPYQPRSKDIPTHKKEKRKKDEKRGSTDVDWEVTWSCDRVFFWDLGEYFELKSYSVVILGSNSLAPPYYNVYEEMIYSFEDGFEVYTDDANYTYYHCALKSIGEHYDAYTPPNSWTGSYIPEGDRNAHIVILNTVTRGSNPVVVPLGNQELTQYTFKFVAFIVECMRLGRDHIKAAINQTISNTIVWFNENCQYLANNPPEFRVCFASGCSPDPIGDPPDGWLLFNPQNATKVLVLHEYGHKAQYQFGVISPQVEYGGGNPTGVGVTPSFAFIEGWPWFFAASVIGSPQLTPVLNLAFDPVYSTAYSTHQYTPMTPFDGVNDLFNVAALLWSVYTYHGNDNATLLNAMSTNVSGTSHKPRNLFEFIKRLWFYFPGDENPAVPYWTRAGGPLRVGTFLRFVEGTSIQAAINLAGNKELVYVTEYPTEYVENITIANKTIGLFGAGPAGCIIRPLDPIGANTINVYNPGGPDYSVVDGFMIKGGNVGIDAAQASKAYVSNNVIQDNKHGVCAFEFIVLKNNVIRVNNAIPNSAGFFIPNSGATSSNNSFYVYNNVFDGNAVGLHNRLTNVLANGRIKNNCFTRNQVGLRGEQGFADNLEASQNGFYGQTISDLQDFITDGADLTGINPHFEDYFFPASAGDEYLDMGWNPPDLVNAQSVEFGDRTEQTADRFFTAGINENAIGLYGGPEAFLKRSPLLPPSMNFEFRSNITNDLNVGNYEAQIRNDISVLNGAMMWLTDGASLVIDAGRIFTIEGVLRIDPGANIVFGVGSRLEVFGTVDIMNGATIELPSAADIRFKPGSKLQLGLGAKLVSNGKFEAIGTPASPVEITSSATTPASGDWILLGLKGGPNTLRHCDVKYSQGGVYFNNTSTNLLDSCTVKYSSGYAVQAFNTSLTANSVKVRDCTIENNEAGLWVGSGRVDIVQTSSTFGIRNNPGYASVLYTGGKLYLDSTYITNNEWGVYVNGTTAQATFSPDGIARGYNRVRDNSFGQIWVQTGSAFLGNTNTICRCDPPPDYGDGIRLDEKKSGGGGIETNCLPPCYVVPVEYGGYNYVSGNYYWVKQETYPGTYARLTYWGQPQVCPPPSAAFYGSVDRTECKTGGGMNILAWKDGEPTSLGGESLLDSTLIIGLLQNLKDEVVSGSVGARPALHQLASLCGVGGKFTHLLRMDWRNFLDHVLTRNVPVVLKNLVRAYRLQDMMDKKMFDEAVVYANVLSNIQDDELWFHAQSTIIYALVAKGQTEQANAQYQTIKGRAAGINPMATVHLEYFLGIQTSSQGAAGKGWPMAVTGDATTERPSKTSLDGNYPNPFNPSTTIRYTLADPSFVSLRVYDLLGREARRLVDEVQNPGSHSAVFDASGLASGIYFYKLQAGAFTAVKRMVIVK